MSDEHQAEAQTKYYLHVWAEYIETCHQAGLPIKQKTSLKDAISLLRNNKLVHQGEDYFMEKDGWGNDYHWKVTQHGDDTIIRISSDGPNGPRGSVKNYYIEVSVPRHGNVRILSSSS
jgi:restriction endonuclease S subunit